MRVSSTCWIQWAGVSCGAAVIALTVASDGVRAQSPSGSDYVTYLLIGLGERPLRSGVRPAGSLFLPYAEAGSEAEKPREPDSHGRLRTIGWQVQIGGPTLGLALHGDRVVRGEGPHVVLERFDDAFELARSPMLERLVRGMTVAGDHAYAVVGAAGLVVYAIGDETLREAGHWQPTGGGEASAVAVDGDTGLVLLDDGRLFVLNLRRPEAPATVAAVSLGRRARWDGRGLALEDDVAVVALQGDQVWLIDVRRPSEPKPAVTIPWLEGGGDGVRDVALENGRVVLLTCGTCLDVWDVRDPGRPRRRSEGSAVGA